SCAFVSTRVDAASQLLSTFLFNGTPTPETYTLSYTMLFRSPERDPRGGLRGESARAGEEVRGQDEHDHGDADTADVRIDPEQIAQETADESADQQTARKQGNAQDDHARASLSKSCLRLDRKRARNSLAYEPPLPGTCFRISTWTRTGVAVWSNW